MKHRPQDKMEWIGQVACDNAPGKGGATDLAWLIVSEMRTDAGEFWMAPKTAADKLGISERTVKRHLAWLEAHEHIKKLQAGGGRCKTTRWALAFKTGTDMAGFSENSDNSVSKPGQICPETVTDLALNTIEDSNKDSGERGSRAGARSPPPARGRLLPEDWRPSEADIAFAKQEIPELDVEREIDRFRDYWHGAAGSKARKRDWAATWRNWIRRESDSQRGPPSLSDIDRGVQNVEAEILGIGGAR